MYVRRGRAGVHTPQSKKMTTRSAMLTETETTTTKKTKTMMVDGHGNDTVMDSQSILRVAVSLSPLAVPLSLPLSHCLRFGLCRVLLNVLKHE